MRPRTTTPVLGDATAAWAAARVNLREWLLDPAAGLLTHANGLTALVPDPAAGRATWTLVVPVHLQASLDDEEARRWQAKAADAYAEFHAARH
jgi:hypothetical protein